MRDANGSGILTEDDFVHVAKRVLAAYGATETFPKGKAVLEGTRKALLQFWTSIDPDTPGNTLFGRH